MITTQGAVWINVKGRSGYIAKTDVNIFDKEKRFFYGTKKGERFNLPSGIYGVAGTIERLPVPIDYKQTVPPVERSDRPYNAVEVLTVDNPNKASVLFKNGVARIYMDKSIAAMPLGCRCYVIAHELAHADYTGEGNVLENKCDCAGESRLLAHGWNPRQLKAANKLLLNSGWRKSQCEKRLLQNFRK